MGLLNNLKFFCDGYTYVFRSCYLIFYQKCIPVIVTTLSLNKKFCFITSETCLLLAHPIWKFLKRLTFRAGRNEFKSKGGGGG